MAYSNPGKTALSAAALLLMAGSAILGWRQYLTARRTTADALAERGRGEGLAASAADDGLRSPEQPPPAIGIPADLADIIALIEAEEPVPVGAVDADEEWAAYEALKPIRLRYWQGDRAEALRLYREYADKHPGTSAAAMALYATVLHDTGCVCEEPAVPAMQQLEAAAAELVMRNPGHYLTRQLLYIIASGSSDSEKRQRHGLPNTSIGREDWQRGVRHIALLVGRYPKEPAGWLLLSELASACHESPHGGNTAVRIYGYVANHGVPPQRFDALRFLHDRSWDRGDTATAERFAAQAGEVPDARELYLAQEQRTRAEAEDEAGTGGPGEFREARAPPQTPWGRLRTVLFPPPGDVLLEAPDWKPGDSFHLRFSGRRRDVKTREWTSRPKQRKKPLMPRPPDVGGVYLVAETATPGEFCVVVSDGLKKERLYPTPEGHGYTVDDLTHAYVERLPLPRQPPRWRIVRRLLAMPEFPVREGIEVCEHEGVAWIQEASSKAGIVEVRFGCWRHEWTPGEAWWDRMEYEDSERMWGPWTALTDGGAAISVDVAWERYVLAAERTSLPADQPGLRNLERRALDCSWYPSEKVELLAPVVLERLPQLFSGEELRERREWWTQGRKPSGGPQGGDDGDGTEDTRSAARRGEVERAIAAAKKTAVEQSRALLAAGQPRRALTVLHRARGEVERMARKLPCEDRPLARSAEGLELEARAELALGRPMDAARTLRWAFEEERVEPNAELVLLLVRAWRACGRYELALNAARRFLETEPEDPERRRIETRISELETALAQRDPTDWRQWQQRFAWTPPGYHRWITGVRVETGVAGARIIVEVRARRKGFAWSIDANGAAQRLPDVPGRTGLDDDVGDGDWGQVSAEPREIGSRKGRGFFHVADRISARDSQGNEVWRYTVPNAAEGELSPRWYMYPSRPGHRGFPIVVDPGLVQRGAAARIVFGVRQRTVFFGMGVGHEPAGGSVAALEMDGRLAYQRDLGYCEQLLLLPRPGDAPLVVGLFVDMDPTTDEEKSWDDGPDKVRYWLTLERQRWSVCALDAWTGETVWQAELPGSTRHYGSHDRRPLLSATTRGEARILINLGDSLFVLSRSGKEVARRETGEIAEIADLDADGTDELVLRSTYSEAVCVANQDGVALWTAPSDVGELYGVADLDGDGRQELIHGGDGKVVVSGFGVTSGPQPERPRSRTRQP